MLDEDIGPGAVAASRIRAMEAMGREAVNVPYVASDRREGAILPSVNALDVRRCTLAHFRVSIFLTDKTKSHVPIARSETQVSSMPPVAEKPSRVNAQPPPGAPEYGGAALLLII